MVNGKWTLIFVIIEAIVVHNTAYITNNPKAYKLVTQISSGKGNKSGILDYMLSTVDKCKYKCTIAYIPHSSYNGARPRFIDLSTNASADDSEMESPSPKFSFLNLLTGDGTEDDNDSTIETDYYGEEKIKEEEDELNDEDNDDGGIDFFGFDDEEEGGETQLKDEDNEGSLKQYHRQRFRMHDLVFPLLLAYKLKFFTVIPLLLGSLVLLVGTTGVAGFFFALFAAALGIHVKYHNDH